MGKRREKKRREAWLGYDHIHLVTSHTLHHTTPYSLVQLHYDQHRISSVQSHFRHVVLHLLYPFLSSFFSLFLSKVRWNLDLDLDLKRMDGLKTQTRKGLGGRVFDHLRVCSTCDTVNMAQEPDSLAHFLSHFHFLFVLVLLLVCLALLYFVLLCSALRYFVLLCFPFLYLPFLSFALPSFTLKFYHLSHFTSFLYSYTPARARVYACICVAKNINQTSLHQILDRVG